MKNIVLINTHDTGRHFGCYGHSTLQTPAVDRFAADGVLLTNAFATAPICSPARCSLLTGLYPQQHGVMDLVGPRGWKLRDPSKHLASRLRRHGYETCLVGTQHEIRKGCEDQLGFDRVEGQSVPGIGQPSADRVAEILEGIFRERAARPGPTPFYFQVGLFETHSPFDFRGARADEEAGVEVPPYLVDDEGNRRQMAAFQGAVKQADRGIGRILNALEKNKLSQDTLVIITTDHGIEMPRSKWELFDPGLGISLILRCPVLGIDSGRRVESLVSSVDFLPTVLELLGIPGDESEGRSFAGHLLGRRTDEIRDAMFAMFGQRGHPRCVRTRTHKLIRFFNDFGINASPVAFNRMLERTISNPVLLYDLTRDPGEFEDLSKQESSRSLLDQMEGQLWEWMETVGDPLLEGPVASPTYRTAIADYQTWKHESETKSE